MKFAPFPRSHIPSNSVMALKEQTKNNCFNVSSHHFPRKKQQPFFLRAKPQTHWEQNVNTCPNQGTSLPQLKVLSRDLRQVNHDFGTSKKMMKQKHGCVLSSMKGLGYPFNFGYKVVIQIFRRRKIDISYEASRVFQLHKLNPHCLQYIKKRTGFWSAHGNGGNFVSFSATFWFTDPIEVRGIWPNKSQVYMFVLETSGKSRNNQSNHH